MAVVSTPIVDMEAVIFSFKPFCHITMNLAIAPDFSTKIAFMMLVLDEDFRRVFTWCFIDALRLWRYLLAMLLFLLSFMVSASSR